MNRTNQARWIFGLLTILGLASLTPSQEPPAPQKVDGLQDPIEVLTRGPIHEAFAQPVIQEPVAPTPIDKEPPPPIAEDPPQERPDIENAQWMPGYWSWDLERQQFLWVSGVYRVAPQGRTFVPGYWENTPQGWRWIAGFWSNNQQQELPYTPEPPAPIETVPGPAPDDNAIYIPGSWIYRTDRFVWRGGYWSAARAGSVWVPSQYHWTPNGYLFNDGYWDEPYDTRGVVYAPVYFNRPLWRDPNWRYRPNFVVGFGAFFDSAFICGNGFYFGNFYGPQYARLGYNPWYAGRGRYDPVFAYHGWQNHRNNPNWINNVQTTYADRSAGRGNAPPRTFAQQTALVSEKKGSAIVAPANQFKSDKVRLVNSTAAQVETQRAQGQRTREIAVNRQQLDVAAAKQGNQTIGNRSQGFKLPAVLETRTNPPQGTTISNNPPRVIETRPGATLPKIETTIPKNNPGNVVPPKFEGKKNNPPPVVTPTPKFETKNNNPPPIVTPPKNVTTPKVEIRNNPPPIVAPPPPPKVEIRNNPPPPIVQPKVVAPPTQPPQVPRGNPVPPPQVPRVNPTPPPPAPRVNPAPPPAPRVNPPAPRVNPPAPPPRANPPAPKRAAINVNPPKIATTPIQRPKTVTAPAPRVQAPPPPRVQSPPARVNNPAPAAKARKR